MAYETEMSLIIKVKPNAKVKMKSADLEAIAAQAIRVIERRTAAGTDKDGNAFKGYSQDYINSDEFAAAGKSAGNVNLRLMGEMMTSLDVLKASSGRAIIGFEDDEQRAKAHGHCTGADGRLPIRNFMGLSREELGVAVRRSGVARSIEAADAIVDSLEVV